MTRKIGTIAELCSTQLTYNLEEAFRLNRESRCPKWLRESATPELLKQCCKHRQEAHEYLDNDLGYCFLIARNKLTQWGMNTTQLHYFYGLYRGAGEEGIN